jgi:hypothetical protein
MKKVKVHSNSIRGKVFVIGDGLVLNFDEKGDAECFASDLPQLKAYSRARPGRFTIVEKAKKAAPAPAPAPKKVEKVEKAAKKEESKSTKDESDNTRRAPKKKAPKKSFFKKDEE